MADTMIRLAPDMGGPRRVRLTRQMYYRLAEMELLERRCELIDGEIIEKMPQGWMHTHVVVRLMTFLVALFGGDCVRVQMPLRVPGPEGEFSEPEPDIAVTARPITAYRGDQPDTGEVLLIVEVSDTSLTYDLTAKARLYARAGIHDYWVVDVNARRLHVLRDPGPDGYRSVTVHAETEAVALLLRPDASVRLSDLLPAPDDAPPA